MNAMRGEFVRSCLNSEGELVSCRVIFDEQVLTPLPIGEVGQYSCKVIVAYPDGLTWEKTVVADNPVDAALNSFLFLSALLNSGDGTAA